MSKLLFGLSTFAFFLFIGTVALDKNETFGCEKINDIKWKDLCYYNVVAGNTSIYRAFETPGASAYYAGGLGNESLCEKIQGDYIRDLCYGGVVSARGNKDVPICNKILDSERKNTCHLNVAFVTKDALLCKDVKGIAQKVMCVAVARRTELLCNFIVWDNDLKTLCFHGVAVGRLDESACKNIRDAEKKDECYTDVAIAKQDASLCNKTADTKKVDCYYLVAQVKRDESVCDKIRNSKDTEYCYVNVAKIKKDESLCMHVQDDKYRETCYILVAEAKLDESLCEIQGSRVKDVCYEHVAEAKKGRVTMHKNPRYQFYG